MLVDLTPKGVTGSRRRDRLERAGITCNKNGIPFDPLPPMHDLGPAGRLAGRHHPRLRPGGVPPGRAAWIGEVLDGAERPAATIPRVEAKVRGEVLALTARFPIYNG